jgi:hypothetical protein
MAAESGGQFEEFTMLVVDFGDAELDAGGPRVDATVHGRKRPVFVEPRL